MKIIRLLTSVITMSVVGCVQLSSECQVDRKSAAYKEAVCGLGDDATTAFQKQQQRGILEFYAMGEHANHQNVWFPGLSEKEVEEYITHKKVPFEVRFENMAPVIVTEDGMPFDSSAYFAAVDDFLSAYNRLVLHEAKRRARKA